MSPNRRVVLRDGALLVLGLCAGCLGDKADSGPGLGSGGGGLDGVGGSSGGGGGGDGGQDTGPAFDPCAIPDDVGGAGWSAVFLEAHPALAEVGGGAQVDVAGLRLVLGQPSAGCFVAVSRICTHEGCETDYDGGRFVCPCHGAVFDLDGSVLSGPTNVPVAAYPAAAGEGVVWVKTG